MATCIQCKRRKPRPGGSRVNGLCQICSSTNYKVKNLLSGENQTFKDNELRAAVQCLKDLLKKAENTHTELVAQHKLEVNKLEDQVKEQAQHIQELKKQNDDLHQKYNKQMEELIPKNKGGRPPKNVDDLSETRKRQILKTSFEEAKSSIEKRDCIIENITATITCSDKTKTFSDGTEENSLTCMNKLFRLARSKTKSNLSNAAITNILGEDEGIGCDIKGYRVSKFQKLVKDHMKKEITISPFTFDLPNKKLKNIKGCYIDVKELLQFLMNNKYSDLISTLKKKKKKLHLRLSGDGRNSAGHKDFTLITLSFFSPSSYASAEDTHTIGLMEIGEDRNALKEVFNYLNPLLEDVAINGVDGIELEFHFCSDWKFLSLVLGINAANSNHFCPFCSIHSVLKTNSKLELKDVYFRELVEVTEDGKSVYRTKVDSCFFCDKDVLDNATKKNRSNAKLTHETVGDIYKCHEDHGFQENCVISGKVISMKRIYIDVLHSLLRISDVLEDALIAEVKRCGTVSEFTKAIEEQCGFEWKFVHKLKDKEENIYEISFNTLNGNQKKLLLKKLRNFGTFILNSGFDYSTFKVKDLRRKCIEYNLSDKGKKQVLILRLNNRDQNEDNMDGGTVDIIKHQQVLDKWREIFERTNDIMEYLNCKCPYTHNHIKKKNVTQGELNCQVEHRIKTIEEYKSNLDELKKLMINVIGSTAIKGYFHLLEYHSIPQIKSENNPYHSLAPMSCSAQELKNKMQTIIQNRNSNRRHVTITIIEYELCSLWFDCNTEQYLGKLNGASHMTSKELDENNIRFHFKLKSSNAMDTTN